MFMELDEIELDDKAVSILRTLRDLNGSGTTRDIRDALDMPRGVVNYRIDEYFEPHGLVNGHIPRSDPGEMPPKQLELTDRGIEYLDTVADTTDGDSIPGRISILEKEVEELRNENKELENNLSAIIKNIGTIDWIFVRAIVLSELSDISDIELKETHHRIKDKKMKQGELIGHYSD